MKVKKVTAEKNSSKKKVFEEGFSPVKRSSVLMYEQQVKYLPLSLERLREQIEVLERRKGLLRWALIKHDKDTDKEGELVAPHYHVVLQFRKRVTVDLVAKRFKDKPQQFEIMTKRGQGAKNSAENAFAYLIHRTTNSREKYQYDASEVIANFDFSKFVQEQEERLRTPDDVLDLLGEGKLTRQEAIEEISFFGAAKMSEYRRKIDDVFAMRIELDYQEWLQDMERKGEPIKVIWCFGLGGTGKTRYAKDWADRHDLNHYICSGSNSPFDGLNNLGSKQQEVLIIDELRPGVLKYHDLLQILDPWNFEKIAVARYRNPRIMAKVIFVCTVYSPLDFYRNTIINNRSIDTFKQLSRRIGVTIEFTHDGIYEVQLSTETGLYERVKRYENQYISHTREVAFSIDDLETYGKFDEEGGIFDGR